MSNLKNKLGLNKLAVDNDFEQGGGQVTENVAVDVYNAVCSLLKAHELIQKDQYFIPYLNSKGYNGEEIAKDISDIYDELNEMQRNLYEAADKAEY